MTPESLQRLAEDRQAQGLPRCVSDRATLAKVAAVLAGAPRNGTGPPSGEPGDTIDATNAATAEGGRRGQQ